MLYTRRAGTPTRWCMRPSENISTATCVDRTDGPILRSDPVRDGLTLRVPLPCGALRLEGGDPAARRGEAWRSFGVGRDGAATNGSLDIVWLHLGSRCVCF